MVAIKLILSNKTFFLNNPKTGLSDQQKENLQIDLSELEIETAISEMAKGKALSPNGLVLNSIPSAGLS